MSFNSLCSLVLLLSLGTAGCVSSEPALVAGRAIEAARKGKLTEFRNQLAPRARLTLGSEEGVEAIRQMLAHYTKLSIGPALLISSKKGDQGNGTFGDVSRTYEAIVAGSTGKGARLEPIYMLRLQCSVGYYAYHHDEVSDTCSTTIDSDGIPWTNCSGGSPAYDSVDLGESCAIAEIEASERFRLRTEAIRRDDGQ